MHVCIGLIAFQPTSRCAGRIVGSSGLDAAARINTLLSFCRCMYSQFKLYSPCVADVDFLFHFIPPMCPG